MAFVVMIVDRRCTLVAAYITTPRSVGGTGLRTAPGVHKLGGYPGKFKEVL